MLASVILPIETIDMAWPPTGSVEMQNLEANMRVIVAGYIHETTCAHVLVTAKYWINYNF